MVIVHRHLDATVRDIALMGLGLGAGAGVVDRIRVGKASWAAVIVIVAVGEADPNLGGADGARIVVAIILVTVGLGAIARRGLGGVSVGVVVVAAAGEQAGIVLIED